MALQQSKPFKIGIGTANRWKQNTVWKYEWTMVAENKMGYFCSEPPGYHKKREDTLAWTIIPNDDGSHTVYECSKEAMLEQFKTNADFWTAGWHQWTNSSDGSLLFCETRILEMQSPVLLPVCDDPQKPLAIKAE